MCWHVGRHFNFRSVRKWGKDCNRPDTDAADSSEVRHCIIGVEARARVGVQVEERLYSLHIGCGKSANKANNRNTCTQQLIVGTKRQFLTKSIHGQFTLCFHPPLTKSGNLVGSHFYSGSMTSPPFSTSIRGGPLPCPPSLTVMDGAPSWNPKIAPRAQFCTSKPGTET